MQLSWEERGIYVSLLCRLWLAENQMLPLDYKYLGNLLGIHTNKMRVAMDRFLGKHRQNMGGVCATFFKITTIDGVDYFYQKRLGLEWEKANKISETKRVAQRKSVKARLENKEENQLHMQSTCKTGAITYAKDMQLQNVCLYNHINNNNIKIKEKENNIKEKESATLEIEEIKKPEKTGSGYSDNFEILWEEYPRKIGKQTAYRNYQARLKEKVSHDDMLKAVINYKKDCISKGTQEQFIKHASTFLGRDKHYEDFLHLKAQEDTKVIKKDNNYSQGNIHVKKGLESAEKENLELLMRLKNGGAENGRYEKVG